MNNIFPELNSNTYMNQIYVNQIKKIEAIHQKKINIVIYQRDIKSLKRDIKILTNKNIQFRSNGTKEEVLTNFDKELKNNDISIENIQKDLKKLLEIFESITNSRIFRFHLLTVNNDMCSKFHTDVNDLRLLCTYSGKGTFWLPEEAVNRLNYNIGKDDNEIILDDKLIQEANTGDVLILKGALYPESNAVIHKSPSIEDSKSKRLLLRIDTNENGIFI
ncbi:MAG: DUF1826 domain-containing protein [Bacteroidia bacterium]|nr:DUF1826 domain-containing protein [Bacteroidia bacterium]